MLGLLGASNSWIEVITLFIVGPAYVLDGLGRRWAYQIYLGSAAFVGIIWYLLHIVDIENMQAYIIPFGLWVVAMSLSERYRRQPTNALVLGTAGLTILLGTAFVQSFGNIGYAILLLVESLLVLAWGLGTRSRELVQVAIVAMFVNGLVQFSYAFVEMPRFIQIGIIGTILLGSGLAALFLRDKIFILRHSWEKGPAATD